MQISQAKRVSLCSAQSEAQMHEITDQRIAKTLKAKKPLFKGNKKVTNEGLKRAIF
jgi:hypothetical protein